MKIIIPSELAKARDAMKRAIAARDAVLQAQGQHAILEAKMEPDAAAAAGRFDAAEAGVALATDANRAALMRERDAAEAACRSVEEAAASLNRRKRGLATRLAEAEAEVDATVRVLARLWEENRSSMLAAYDMELREAAGRMLPILREGYALADAAGLKHLRGALDAIQVADPLYAGTRHIIANGYHLPQGEPPMPIAAGLDLPQANAAGLEEVAALRRMVASEVMALDRREQAKAQRGAVG